MFPMCACWLRAGPTICPTMFRILLALQETANHRMPIRHWWFQLLFEEVGAELHVHALLLGLCRLHGNLLAAARSSRTTSASGPVLSFLVRLSRAIAEIEMYVCMSGCLCVQSHRLADCMIARPEAWCCPDCDLAGVERHIFRPGMHASATGKAVEAVSVCVYGRMPRQISR